MRPTRVGQFPAHFGQNRAEERVAVDVDVFGGPLVGLELVELDVLDQLLREQVPVEHVVLLLLRVERQKGLAALLELEVLLVVDAAEVLEGLLVLAQVLLLLAVHFVELVLGLRLLEVVPVVALLLRVLFRGLEVLFLDLAQVLLAHAQVLDVLLEGLLHADDVLVVVGLDALLLLLEHEVVEVGALVSSPCRTLRRAFSGGSRRP